jgi:hypothetical protein
MVVDFVLKRFIIFLENFFLGDHEFLVEKVEGRKIGREVEKRRIFIFCICV